ncbi:hypothetical protein Agub_g5244 [Astrephomene gubernaculifera]|uniref:Uncharacterized protein n=1 Tax=Astrephomene gubernaculifera TaxID=47775 RepID=A0AAD3DM11_9CHLO|nr:hypothetical protein Agub_g5244 [Astrephomene gubernaculifera]
MQARVQQQELQRQQEEVRRQQAATAAAEARAQSLAEELGRMRAQAEAAQRAMQQELQELQRQVSQLTRGQGQEAQQQQVQVQQWTDALTPQAAGRCDVVQGRCDAGLMQGGGGITRTPSNEASGIVGSVRSSLLVIPAMATPPMGRGGVIATPQAAAAPAVSPVDRRQLLTPPQPPSRPAVLAASVPAVATAVAGGKVNMAAAEPTPASIRSLIEAHGSSGGITAAALVRHFQAAAAGCRAWCDVTPGSVPHDKAMEIRNCVTKALQDLVDDFEVVRQGVGASKPSVDVTCEQTSYLLM